MFLLFYFSPNLSKNFCLILSQSLHFVRII